jgi:hypothetical protein
MEPVPQNDHVLVDGHVHFHADFDPADFLDAAVRNLHAAAATHDLVGAGGCLLFTESRGADFFRSLRDGTRPVPGWTFRSPDEAESLRAESDAGDALTLVAGRQIVTRERLEVLALAVDVAPEDVEDGGSIADTIDRVADAGGLPTIPWGFGKWTGDRGRLVRETVDRARPGRLFLGDNGGRPVVMARPALFARAESRGIPVLPGTDPLPVAGQADRVGSYGFVLPDGLRGDRPAARLRDVLRELRGSPLPFGRLESLPRFLRFQVAVQLRRLRTGGG